MQDTEMKTIGKEIQTIKNDIEKVALSSKEHQNFDELRVKDKKGDIQKMKEDLEKQPKYTKEQQIADELKEIK